MAQTKIFIDGEAGTTGLQIRDRLASRADLTLLKLDETNRKDAAARKEMLNEADVAILCLPDDAAVEAVSLVSSETTRIIDASSAHRVDDEWVYGFPELEPGHADKVAGASRVTNPGCYPTGFIALVRPLVEAGIVPADHPVSVFGVSGYSGGGKGLIDRYENRDNETHITSGYRVYGLSLAHKHIPEMTRYAKLEHAPLFVPATAPFRQGMLVQVPLELWSLPGHPSADALRSTLAAHYDGSRFVDVTAKEDDEGLAELFPEELVDTNRMRLRVFGNDKKGEALLVAELDNLGKGASGAAVQSLNLMMGLDEATGL